MQTAGSSIYAIQFPVINMLYCTCVGHIRTNILLTVFVGEYFI